MSQGKLDEAITNFRRALALKPDYGEVHSNLGIALRDHGKLEDAVASYRRALAIKPDLPETYSNLGIALRDQGRLEEALANFDRALELRPGFAEAHFHRALCWLLIGDFARGWEGYEWRWEMPQLKGRKRNFLQPLWLGEHETGKTVLLDAEQGFGDTLQFCRYVPLVAQRATHVILRVQKPLCELMSTLPGGAQIVSSEHVLPDFDIYCPLLTLPRVFGTRLETIPS